MSPPRHQDQAGSITVWMLGMCVMLLFIGGLSLDLWRAFSERRALAGIADAAAIAGASGLDDDHYRATRQVRLDPVRAEALAAASISRQTDTGSLTGWHVRATPAHITVAAAGTVELTLLKVLVPMAGPLAIDVTATAPPRRAP